VPEYQWVRVCISGIELYRSPEFPVSCHKIPVVAIQAERKRIVRFAKGVVQFQGLQGSGL
jgi:hypothetical protein